MLNFNENVAYKNILSGIKKGLVIDLGTYLEKINRNLQEDKVIVKIYVFKGEWTFTATFRG